MRRHNIEQLIQKIEHLREVVDVISFDVFDTLLARDVTPPEQIKVAAAKWLVDRAADIGRELSIAEVLQARKAAEALLRKQTEDESGDHEFPLGRIAAAWAEQVLGQTSCDGVAESLVNVEIAAELAICRAVPGMHEVVLHARSLGKKVLLLSDMHLGREHICQLLEHNGFGNCYDELYVSSELGLLSPNGCMLMYIAEVHQVTSSRWVHIGATMPSNTRILKLLGIELLMFEDSESRKKASEARRLRRLGEMHSSWYGAQCTQWCQPPSETRVRDVPYMVGFYVLGPLLTGFMHKVLDRVREKQVRLVLFPARDGFVLRRLFGLIKPAILPDAVVRDEYVFINRKVTYLASMDNIGFRELSMGLWTRIPTLQTMLSRFSLDPMGFQDIAKVCGLTLDQRLQKMDDPRLLHFVRHPEVLRRLRQTQKVKRDLLQQYLEQVGFWETDRVALVDLGWNGTTQDALTWAFMGVPKWPRFYGWYLGFRPHLAPVKTPTSTYEGLIYERDHHGQHRAAVCRHLELLELATRAPHATIVDFSEDEKTGEIYPVLKPESSASRQAELRDRKLVTAMQAGIFDFAEAYAKTVTLQDRDLEAFCDYACEVTDLLLRYPTSEVSHALSDYFHGEDFGTDVVAQRTRAPMNVWNPQHWLTLSRNRSQVLWIEGVLARTGAPALLGLYNLYRAVRERHY